ncbi:MAG TPA: type II secretion system F family protein [Candidatus Dormibacteraeota bacterium]|nr:type II secretion system F family protein [Candidatus Dormibacteraeota bacterium]
MSLVALVAGCLLAAGIVLVTLAVYVTMRGAGLEDGNHEPAGGNADGGTLIEKFIDQLTLPFARQGRATRTAEALSRANLSLRPQEWYLVRVLFPLLVFVLTVLVSTQLPLALLLALAAFFLPTVLLRARRNHRRTDVIKQLPEALQVMSNALQTGASVSQSIAAVAESLPAPIGEEFGRIDRELQLGLSLDDALARIAARIDSRDLAMVVSAIQINREMGGTLATVLESISATMRERIRLKDRIRVLTSQVRLSSRLITLLPIGVAVLLLVIAPSYMAPLFTTVAGFMAIVVGAILVSVAYFVMSRLVDIEI